MRVEQVGALHRARQHDDAPAAHERFLEQRRKHVLQPHVLQMIEQTFRHRHRTRRWINKRLSLGLIMLCDEMVEQPHAITRTPTRDDAVSYTHLTLPTTDLEKIT